MGEREMEGNVGADEGAGVRPVAVLQPAWELEAHAWMREALEHDSGEEEERERGRPARKGVLQEIRETRERIDARVGVIEGGFRVGSDGAADADGGEEPTVDGGEAAEVLEEPGPEPRRIGTKEAARVLRVRAARLYAAAREDLGAGLDIPGEEVGDGTQRRHLRWDPDGLRGWWEGRRDR